jgi:hypothetical protein
MVTSDTINGSLEQDARFRENLRSQLQEKEARAVASRYGCDLDHLEFVDPYARSALRWLGGVAGVSLLVLGGLWMLSFFDFTLPWYSAFPIMLLIVGGAFVLAAVSTRRRAQ